MREGQRLRLAVRPGVALLARALAGADRAGVAGLPRLRLPRAVAPVRRARPARAEGLPMTTGGMPGAARAGVPVARRREAMAVPPMGPARFVPAAPRGLRLAAVAPEAAQAVSLGGPGPVRRGVPVGAGAHHAPVRGAVAAAAGRGFPPVAARGFAPAAMPGVAPVAAARPVRAMAPIPRDEAGAVAVASLGAGEVADRRSLSRGAGFAAADEGRAAGRSGGRPDQGDVFLDGMRVGRWMSRELARQAGGPQAAGTGFDPRTSPAWPGALQGGIA